MGHHNDQEMNVVDDDVYEIEKIIEKDQRGII